MPLTQWHYIANTHDVCRKLKQRHCCSRMYVVPLASYNATQEDKRALVSNNIIPPNSNAELES
jgi:hypothetical protein